jgi:hypothetical protein
LVWLAWLATDAAGQMTLQQTPPGLPPLGPEREAPVLPPTLPTPGPYPIPIPAPPSPPIRGVQPDRLVSELQAGRYVLIPTFLVDEEYNDNVFSDNNLKRSDFITRFSPGVILGIRDPRYSLVLGYAFTSEIYADQTELNDALARQVATLDGLYRIDPRLRVRLSERYSRDNNTSATALPSISTGRVDSWTNVVAPGLEWDIDPITRLLVGGSWQRTRLIEAPPQGEPLNDFDLYGFRTSLERRLLPRLTGLADFEFAYSDVVGESTATFAGLVGARYQITESLHASLRLGPQYATEGNVGFSLAASALATQIFRWGAMWLSFDRRNAVIGGLPGTAETNAVGAGVEVSGLTRNFAVGLTGAYVTANENTRIDTNAFNIGLTATYRIADWLTAVAAYNFFFQRSSGTQITNDVDQNRVTVGLQVTYPLRLP